jgi:hypothetical protein
MTRFVAPVALAVVLCGVGAAQPPAPPGPELDVLKKMVGTWDATMKMDGMESKGTCVYKMDVGGLWLASEFEGDFGGAKFSGRGYDSYDPSKKKYVGVWLDSMMPSVMVMEGTYDVAKKTMTMEGSVPNPDGMLEKMKTVSVMPDADTIDFKMYMGDGKAPAFTILYKRKK